MSQIHTVSVRAAAEFLLRTGDLRPETLGAARPLEGIRAHQRVQKSRPPGYQAEVPVAGRFQGEGITLHLSGRIDGVLETEDGVIVEEIKSTRRPPEDALAEANPVHWGQLHLYGWLYAEQHDLPSVTLRLVYVGLISGAIREAELRLDREELADYGQILVERYLHWLARLSKLRAARDESVRALEFPFPDWRPGQRELAVRVFRTLRDGERLLTQAPTGVGKTMAALFPAIKALADGHAARIFFLTARTTGRIAAETALASLRASGLRLTSVSLSSRDRACLHPDGACVGSECPMAAGYFDRINEALIDLFDAETAFTPERIAAAGEAWSLCPHELSLDLALWADLVIGDFNYAVDPRVALRRHLGEGRPDGVFLFDEAHHLPDRARESFSAALNRGDLLRLRDRLGESLPAISRDLLSVADQLHFLTPGIPPTEPPPESLVNAVEGFTKRVDAWLLAGPDPEKPFYRPLTEAFFQAVWFARVARTFNTAYAVLSSGEGTARTVRLFCADPTEPLDEALSRGRAAIFFSATLTPAKPFARMFGILRKEQRLRIPSPFPPEHLLVAVANRISTRYRDRERTLPQLAALLAALVRGKPGNYLLFFPSYAYLDQIRPLFESLVPEARTRVQAREMSAAERNAFLDRFSEIDGQIRVGLAVMGGVFGEGIDLVGDRLSGAAVVGPGLPPPSAEREVIRERMAARGADGFEAAYQMPGMVRVLQAAGRVIRSETDRGVVLLADNRFAQPGYFRHFPPEWRPARVGDAAALADRLRRFWTIGNG
ncbi:MAG: helicase C-terminal domain-containing protein [Desulfococcaceae bacterium]